MRISVYSPLFIIVNLIIYSDNLDIYQKNDDTEVKLNMPCVDCDEIDNDIFQTRLHHFIAILSLRLTLNYNACKHNLLY